MSHQTQTNKHHSKMKNATNNSTETENILTVRFKTVTDYERAKDHFDLNSDFYAEAFCDEFHALDFYCADQSDMDATEHALDAELNGIGVFGFWFEAN